MSQRIAFFDFDGTITTKDTLLEFIRFYRGTSSFYKGFLLYSPFMIAYRLKLIPNWVAKQKILQHFFRGETIERFEQMCDQFADQQLPALIRPKAVREIRELQAAGTQVVIVSASAENWIRRWAALNGVLLIGTRLAVEDHKITGAISGKNCHGDEKVCRIEQHFDLSQYPEIYCYGDTAGDKPMLALGTKSFYKPFR